MPYGFPHRTWAAHAPAPSNCSRYNMPVANRLTISKWSLRSLDPHTVKVVSFGLQKST